MTIALRSLHVPERIRSLPERDDTAGEPLRQLDFDCAGNALMRAVKKARGAEFTPDLWHAWVEALCDISQILAKAAPRGVKARAFEPA